MKMFRVVVNGNEYKVGIEEIAEERATGQSVARPAPSPQPVQARPAAAPRPEPAKAADPGSMNGKIIAPMPGTILRVAVNAGEKAIKGQTLMVLEAMKMENEILAPSDGTIKEVAVSQGVSVNVGDTLVVMST